MPSINISDKIQHTAAYAVLAVLFILNAATANLGSTLERRPYFWASTVILVYACSDELHQMFVPGRTADPFDWLADAVGVFIGLAAFALYRIIRRKTERAA